MSWRRFAAVVVMLASFGARPKVDDRRSRGRFADIRPDAVAEDDGAFCDHQQRLQRLHHRGDPPRFPGRSICVRRGRKDKGSICDARTVLKVGTAQKIVDLKKWCSGLDSNQHGLPHTPLKRACLPISPPEHFSRQEYEGDLFLNELGDRVNPDLFARVLEA